MVIVRQAQRPDTMGFDVELASGASKKDASICPHCHLILEEPHQTEEGVRLCKDCLLEIKRYYTRVCSYTQMRMRTFAVPC